MTKGQYLRLILQEKGLTYQQLADLMMEYRTKNWRQFRTWKLGTRFSKCRTKKRRIKIKNRYR